MTGIAQPIHRAAVVPTREFDIFCMLAEGGSYAEIAQTLSPPKKSVANYAIRLQTI